MDKKTENINEEIDLLEIAKVILSKWWVVLLCSVLAAIAAFGVSAVMPEKYQSYTTMYVKNSNDAERDERVLVTDINASKSLVSTYIAVLKSDAIMENISDMLLKKYDVAQLSKVLPIKDGAVSTAALKNSFVMSSVEDTEVMKITAKTKSAEVSADLCNMIAKIAPDFLVRVVGAGSVEVIDPAKVNFRAVEPNATKMALLGFLLGFFASSGILVIVYLLDNSIKSAEELSKIFNAAMIGEVYNFEQEKGESQKKRKKGEARPHSPDELINADTVFTVMESYKTMRTNAIFALSPFDNKVFALTSANASEGKSITTANLAIAFAQTENKVLLIDADMRKPTQHILFGVKHEKGLSTVIGKMNKLGDCIIHEVRKNLDLMPAGSIPPNPSELLASQNFNNIIAELSDKYDYIIIDTPPVNVVSDVLVINESVAGVMFVTRYNSTLYDDVEQAKRKLDLAEMKLLGFILNDIKVSNTKKYYGKYKRKYGYAYQYYGNKTETKKE